IAIGADLVALHDVLVRNLLAVRRADPLHLDALAVLVVELVEADRLLRDGAVELDRHVHQPEADRASPDRPRHTLISACRQSYTPSQGFFPRLETFMPLPEARSRPRAGPCRLAIP